MSGMVLGECASDECTMDHAITFSTDEQARLDRLLGVERWSVLMMATDNGASDAPPSGV